MPDRQAYMQDYHKDYKKLVYYASIALARKDHERIAKQAERYGLKPAAYMRALILERAGAVKPVPPEIHQELKQLRLLMRNIANNVNQMAHHSHIIRQVDDEKGLFAQLRQLEQTIVAYTHNRLRGQ